MRGRFLIALVAGCAITAAGFLTLLYFVHQRSPVPETELRSSMIEFLRTTDVSGVLMENTVTIENVYDDTHGGRIVVVEYATTCMGHPTFMLEAIENHVAAITLDTNGHVVSAFCIHENGVLWDLINQRWIPG